MRQSSADAFAELTMLPANTGRNWKPGIVALAIAALGGWHLAAREPATVATIPGAASSAPIPTRDAARQAYESRARGKIIAAEGAVERILADDRDGSPHQRFIIRTDGGISLLIAHNLALAPRLDGLRAGDRVRVLGEYEWNGQGGVMHWTHDDPAGNHAAGYIEWRGRRYQ
jgi:hypothetical protein